MGLFGKKKENKSNNQIQNPQLNNVNSVNKKVQPQKSINKKVPKKNKEYEDPNHVSALELYDDMLSNIKAQKLMIPSAAVLNNEQLSLEWGRIVSRTSITKMFIVEKMDNWVPHEALQLIKEATVEGIYTVRFNYFMNLEPYHIDWESPKMKQNLKLWGARIKNDTVDRDDVFTQRETAGETNVLKNKQQSFQYFNEVDLKHRRTIFKENIFVQIIGQRDKLEDLDKAIANFRGACSVYGVNINELSADVFDWMRAQLPTSMRTIDALEKKIPKQIMSDDTVTILQSNGQGKIGKEGVPLGLDVYSGLPVLHVFREDKTAAENVLISAGTGGGKSVFVKNIVLWCLKEGMSVCVLDYEGDEYVNLAKYINQGRDGEAVIVNMNAGSGRYFDPLRISDPTGAEEIDKDSKVEAQDFTKAMLKVLMGEKKEDGTVGISLEEDAILSQLITRIYSEHGITDNPKTWHKSKDLRISMVYDILCRFIEQRRFIDKSGDDTLHLIAKRMQLKLKKYFVEGESEYGTFGEVLDVNTIRNARFIDFSFGNKGADQQGANAVKVALKQLCVSKITNELSNYNKYVKKTNFTLKIWEEVQRFVNIPGAEEIMKNCVTGGRKRGDIAFIITNDLASLLEGETPFMKALKSNIQGYCVGYIPDEDTRARFCDTFGLQLLKPDLDRIYQENAQKTQRDSNGNVIQSAFKNAFLVKFNATSKSPAIQTIVKSAVNPTIFSRNIFDVGKIDGKDEA